MFAASQTAILSSRLSRLEGLRASLRARQRQAQSGTPADDRMFAYSRDMFVHVNEHRAVFRSVVGKRSGPVIQQLFHKMLIDLVRDDVKTLVPPKAGGATPHEAVVQLIAGGLFGLVLWWVDGPMKLSVEEVDTCSASRDLCRQGDPVSVGRGKHGLPKWCWSPASVYTMRPYQRIPAKSGANSIHAGQSVIGSCDSLDNARILAYIRPEVEVVAPKI